MKVNGENYTMPYGKYRGQLLDNIPASYLLWLRDQKALSVQRGNKLYHYVENNLEWLKKEAENERKGIS